MPHSPEFIRFHRGKFRFSERNLKWKTWAKCIKRYGIYKIMSQMKCGSLVWEHIAWMFVGTMPTNSRIKQRSFEIDEFGQFELKWFVDCSQILNGSSQWIQSTIQYDSENIIVLNENNLENLPLQIVFIMVTLNSTLDTSWTLYRIRAHSLILLL